MDSARYTCLRLEVQESEREKEVIFVKGTWFATHFKLSITDGLHAWTCIAPESEVSERAEQWDQAVSEYLETAERYLGFQQPGSVYRFVDAGDGHRRLSWTFEKQGTKLEWRWKCQPSSNNKQTTVEILDFLMDANIRLSEEVVRKTQSFERLKVEAEKCLTQSEKLKTEKAEFESAVYAKFVAVLNSKKAKLRELRDRLQKQEITTGKTPEEEDDSTDKTESYHEGSDDGESKEAQAENLAGTSSSVSTSKLKGQKRKARP
ncbi:DNA repair protein XRCC4 [Aristolochia californica]|uniref:DNA repair protein XRCC4 n=1 Tax=Aristolochia californica TaxID=171875 RepID=UPI0035DDDB2B